MESKKENFQWPKREDKLWIKVQDVLFEVTEPIPTGRRGRMFHLHQNDKERFEQIVD